MFTNPTHKSKQDLTSVITCILCSIDSVSNTHIIFNIIINTNYLPTRYSSPPNLNVSSHYIPGRYYPYQIVLQAHQSLYIEFIIFTHHQPRQCTVLLHDKHIQYNVFLMDTLSIIQCSSIIINLTSGDAAVFYPAILTISNIIN